MEKEEVIKELGKPILRFLLWIRFICALAIISSPFIFIWYDLVLACQISVSGIILGYIFAKINNLVKEQVKEIVTKELEKEPTMRKSKFQERLEAMQKSKQEKMKQNV